MRKTLIIAVVAAAALSALAKTPTAVKCPVSGGTVNIASATKNHMYADYKGRRYFFCCDGCPQTFKKDPAKYAKGESIPAPKGK